MTVPNRSRCRYPPGLCGNALIFLRMESLTGTETIYNGGQAGQAPEKYDCAENQMGVFSQSTKGTLCQKIQFRRFNRPNTRLRPVRTNPRRAHGIFSAT